MPRPQRTAAGNARAAIKHSSSLLLSSRQINVDTDRRFGLDKRRLKGPQKKTVRANIMRQNRRVGQQELVSGNTHRVDRMSLKIYHAANAFIIY